MTEREAMDAFETHLANQIRTYTGVAASRRIEPLEVARTAMASREAVGWWPGRVRLGWAAALLTVAVFGAVAVTIQRRPPDTAGGPVPDGLLHAWERPYPVEPVPDVYGSGFLRVANGQVEYGRDPSDASSRSTIAALGTDRLVMTAVAETTGCAVGDVGVYRWLLEGKGTFLTLTAVSPDACPAREEALAGPWVRSDLPPPRGSDVTLEPGTYVTERFDPFGDPAGTGRLSFTVPSGWKVKEDEATAWVLHHLPDPTSGQPGDDVMIAVFTQPGMAAELQEGAICGPGTDAPEGGSSVANLVAAIRARPGVVSTAPTPVTIGGRAGQMLDLQIAESWTGGCRAPEGLVVSIPIIRRAGSEGGPLMAIGPDQPTRLYLLDIADGRTMAIVVFCLGPIERSVFDAQMLQVAPVVESFEFQAPTP